MEGDLFRSARSSFFFLLSFLFFFFLLSSLLLSSFFFFFSFFFLFLFSLWRESTGEDTAAVCRWVASQVRRLMKRVEQLEHPELKFHALHAELLAELDRQRVKGERLAAAATRVRGNRQKRQWRMRSASQSESLPWRKDMTSSTSRRYRARLPKTRCRPRWSTAKELHESRHAEWTYESLKKEGDVASPSPGKGGIHVGDHKGAVASVEGRDTTTSDATLRSGTTSPRRRCQPRPAREGSGRAWEGRGNMKIAEFSVRSAVATDNDVHLREAPERS